MRTTYKLAALGNVLLAFALFIGTPAGARAQTISGFSCNPTCSDGYDGPGPTGPIQAGGFASCTDDSMIGAVAGIAGSIDGAYYSGTVQAWEENSTTVESQAVMFDGYNGAEGYATASADCSGSYSGEIDGSDQDAIADADGEYEPG